MQVYDTRWNFRRCKTRFFSKNRYNKMKIDLWNIPALAKIRKRNGEIFCLLGFTNENQVINKIMLLRAHVYVEDFKAQIRDCSSAHTPGNETVLESTFLNWAILFGNFWSRWSFAIQIRLNYFAINSSIQCQWQPWLIRFH